MRTYHKFSGAGNDFLLFQDFEEDFPLTEVSRLCHRRIGIGADGLILARHSSIADFLMIYCNSDGSPAEMCGNGLRCFVHYLRELGHVKELYAIEVGGNVLTVKCEGTKISTFLPHPCENFEEVWLGKYRGYRIDTGVPHLVVFVDADVDVVKQGRAMRNHPLFQPEGVNVNFVQIMGRDLLSIRTYERGVEGETLACGTGAAAVALIAHHLGKCSEKVRVVPRSKQCLTLFLGNEIEITGPSEKISQGTVRVECTNFQKKI